MPRYKVSTDQGTYMVDLDQEPESDEQLRQLVSDHFSGQEAPTSAPASAPEPAPGYKFEEQSLPKRIAGRTMESFKQFGRGASAIGRLAPGGTPAKGSDLLEALGVFAPFGFPMFSAGEAMGSAAYYGPGRQFAETGTITPGMEGITIDDEHERVKDWTEAEKHQFQLETQRQAALGGEAATTALYMTQAPFPILRAMGFGRQGNALSNIAKGARRLAIEGATIGQKALPPHLGPIEQPASTIEHLLTPKAVTGAAEQPALTGRIGAQKALPGPGETGQISMGGQRIFEAGPTTVLDETLGIPKSRVFDPDELLQAMGKKSMRGGADREIPVGRFVDATPEELATALESDVQRGRRVRFDRPTYETYRAGKIQHIKIGRSKARIIEGRPYVTFQGKLYPVKGSVTRSPSGKLHYGGLELDLKAGPYYPPIKGGAGLDNDQVVHFLREGQGGDELVDFMRRGSREKWTDLGELSPEEAKTLMRLKNRGLIEIEGPKGKARFRWTEDTEKALLGGKTPEYLKMRGGAQTADELPLNIHEGKMAEGTPYKMYHFGSREDPISRLRVVPSADGIPILTGTFTKGTFQRQGLMTRLVMKALSDADGPVRLGNPHTFGGGREFLSDDAWPLWKRLEESGIIRRIKGEWGENPVILFHKMAGGADPLETLRRQSIDELIQWANLSEEAATNAKRLSLAELDQLKAAMHEGTRGVVDAVHTALKAPDSPAATGRVADAVRRFLDISKELRGVKPISRESGRLIQAMADDKRVAKMVADYLGKFDPTSRDYARQIQKFITALEDENLTPRAGFRQVADEVHRVWLNARLSSPWTHVKNFVSNTSALLIRPLERAFAGGIDMIRSAITGSERGIYATEAFSDLVGTVAAIPEAARAALRTFRTGESAFLSTTKLEQLRKAGKLTGRLAPLETVVDLPGKSLVAADEFYKVLSFRGSVKAQMHRLSRQGKRAEDWMFKNIIRDAIAEADRTTFTNLLPSGLQKLSQSRRQIPGLRYIIPFFNTNMNVMIEGVAHVPGLGFMTAGRAAGETALRGFSGSAAKQLAGLTAGVGAALMLQAMGGNITGGGPKDANQRRTLMASGWKPYSVRLPGLPPMALTELTGLAGVLALIGDMHDLGPIVDEGDAAQRIGKTVLQNITYPPFADGLADLLQVWQEGDALGTSAKRFLARQASTLNPAIVQNVADVIDPTVRRPSRYESTGQQMEQTTRSRLPGFQSDVPVLRDIWGRPIKRSLGPLEAIFGRTEPEYDSIDQEIERLAQQYVPTPDGGSAPLLAIGSAVDNIQKNPLTPKQYDTYVERQGELARAYVARLMAQPRWASLSDEYKADLIKKMFAKARERAKSEILRENRDLLARVRQSAKDAKARLRTPRSPGKALEAVRNRKQP